jgi:hypothetical protein
MNVFAVAMFNGINWQVNLGREVIGQWLHGDMLGDRNLTGEAAAKFYAARVNAELAGGVLAYGCDREATQDKNRCVAWCGSEQCPRKCEND